jgi:hypothetical protein
MFSPAYVGLGFCGQWMGMPMQALNEHADVGSQSRREFDAVRVLCGLQEQLFLTPGKPEEQDANSGHYSACSDDGYCMIYDSKGFILNTEQSQQ